MLFDSQITGACSHVSFFFEPAAFFRLIRQDVRGVGWAPPRDGHFCYYLMLLSCRWTAQSYTSYGAAFKFLARKSYALSIPPDYKKSDKCSIRVCVMLL